MMQQKNVYLGMLGALLLASSATVSAQVYVGGGVGVVKPKLACLFESKCDQSESSFKLIGGYTIDKNFAIELNHFGLGSQEFSFSAQQEKATYQLKSHAWSIAGLVHLPITDQFGGFAKAGFAQIKSSAQYNFYGAGSDSFDHAMQSTSKEPHIQLGLGLTYKISDRLSLRAEYEQFRPKSHAQGTSFEAVTVGAQYSF